MKPGIMVALMVTVVAVIARKMITAIIADRLLVVVEARQVREEELEPQGPGELQEAAAVPETPRPLQGAAALQVAVNPGQAVLLQEDPDQRVVRERVRAHPKGNKGELF